MEPTITKFHIYGLGIVAANKPLNSKEIEVFPLEDLPMADGEISDNVAEFTAKGKTTEGQAYESNVAATASIKAVWLPLGGSNRITAPDVRRGEKVVLYKYGDSDKYYWITQEYDMKLRKLETVIFAISNTRDESQDGKPENTYYLEWSTHRKLIHLHTSKSDGEPFVYDIQLNLKDGVFTFQDDIGNYIQLDSKNVRLEMKNAEGSHIDMNRQVLTINIPDTINIIAGSTINMSAPAINTESSQTTNTVPMTTFSGHVQVGGGISVSGGSGGGASAAISGSLEVSGGDIKADDISLKGHKHVAQGASATTTPSVP